MLVTASADQQVKLWEIEVRGNHALQFTCDSSSDAPPTRSHHHHNVTRSPSSPRFTPLSQTGEELLTYPHPGPVRSVAFDDAGLRFVSCSDKFSDSPHSIQIFVRFEDPEHLPPSWAHL